MRELEKLLKDYENDINHWESDFGEGHLFLANREALIPFEKTKEVIELDKKALNVIEKDKSKGSDKLFLLKLRDIILNNINKKIDESSKVA
ncbi:hypothetical protein [Hydrogenimonas thermophila]|uniref:Uncharacterized protein n=1 Tax=Hydrogenimonas thermophila TaxID=223786 RepID=A0A1I5P139_9BACT|nr:hypothetical protein [Hydrogenimonas thermophila]WOE69567.1 hypothetical protein RZR91_10735 [Hydrogenimonas thermophila]WOE72081.1 hypothetical protein RZR97_10725 [Hydrogenimonas thermophila]SFP27717.1 hypothetical protein SAMN05216234_11313 [Hydrogenimonas thermophila]